MSFSLSISHPKAPTPSDLGWGLLLPWGILLHGSQKPRRGAGVCRCAQLRGKRTKQTVKRRWKRETKSIEVSAQEGENQSRKNVTRTEKERSSLLLVKMMSSWVIPHKLWKRLEFSGGNGTTRPWLKYCLKFLEKRSFKELFLPDSEKWISLMSSAFYARQLKEC